MGFSNLDVVMDGGLIAKPLDSIKANMKKIFFLFSILIFFLISCKERNDQEKSNRSSSGISEKLKDKENPNADSSYSDQSGILDSLGINLRYLYEIRPEEYKLKYGEPNSIKIDSIRNVHTGENDEYYRLRYNGFETILYHLVSEDKYLLCSVAISKDIEFGSLSLKINSLESDLLSRLGRPFSETTEKNEIILIYNSNYSDQFNFHFLNHKLSKIEFLPYFD